MNHCCNKMRAHIEKGDIYLHYVPAVRAYSVDYRLNSGGGAQLIKFCPWCGQKLPDELGEQLCEIIDDQLKLDGYDDPSLPEEFKSDLWWRKRQIPEHFNKQTVENSAGIPGRNIYKDLMS